MLSLIVAVDENNLIGHNNQLPWHLPADLKYFKSVTMGKPIIMGRKTFDSIGKPLPGRKNIIITRNNNFKAAGCEVYTDINEAIKNCEFEEECFVIGGAELFRIALPLASKLYLTKIHLQFEGDTFFPAIENRIWKLTAADHHLKDEKNKYDYSFFIYSRLK
jgi:dihydrofolate reductase